MSRGVIWESILVPLKLRRTVKQTNPAAERDLMRPIKKAA